MHILFTPASGIQVIECVHDEVESLEVSDTKARFLNVGMMSNDVDKRVERGGCLLGHDRLWLLMCCF